MIEKRRCGFAAMTPEQRSAISRLGGKAVHARGIAPKWTPEQARKYGQKGGQALARNQRQRMGLKPIIPPCDSCGAPCEGRKGEGYVCECGGSCASMH